MTYMKVGEHPVIIRAIFTFIYHTKNFGTFSFKEFQQKSGKTTAWSFLCELQEKERNNTCCRFKQLPSAAQAGTPDNENAKISHITRISHCFYRKRHLTSIL